MTVVNADQLCEFLNVPIIKIHSLRKNIIQFQVENSLKWLS